MSEMVDRVAQALLASMEDQAGENGVIGAVNETGTIGVDTVFNLKVLARAVLEAMRQPTKEMIVKGNDQAENNMAMDGYESTGFYPVAQPGLAYNVLYVMIDEALKP